MRDIRFRGFGIDLKKWIYGNLVIDDDPCHIDHSVRIVSCRGTVRVEPESVGQYTGKDDIDGMPVYEGDVLEVCNGSVNGYPIRSTVTVKWNAATCSFNVPGWPSDQDDTHWYRVIGNVWEQGVKE